MKLDSTSKKKCIKKEQIEQLDSIIDKMIEEDIKQDEIDKEIYGDKEENLTNLDACVKSGRHPRDDISCFIS